MEDSERLHQAVTEAAENFAPEPDEPFLLRGALLVAEWVTPEGHRQLSFVSTDAQGVGLRSWDIRGYAGEVVAQLAQELDADADEDE